MDSYHSDTGGNLLCDYAKKKLLGKTGLKMVGKTKRLGKLLN